MSTLVSDLKRIIRASMHISATLEALEKGMYLKEVALLYIEEQMFDREYLKGILEKLELEEVIERVQQIEQLKKEQGEEYEFITVADTGGTILHISSTHSDVIGWTEKDVVGESIYNHVHPDDITEAQQKYEWIIQNKKPITAQYRTRNKEGQYIKYDAIGVPVLNSEDEIVCVIITRKELLDITELIINHNFEIIYSKLKGKSS